MKDMIIVRFVVTVSLAAFLSLGFGLVTVYADGTVAEKILENIDKTNKIIGKTGGVLKIVKLAADVGKETHKYSKGEASGTDMYTTACRSVTSVSTGYMGAVAGTETGAVIGLFVGGPVGAGIGEV